MSEETTAPSVFDLLNNPTAMIEGICDIWSETISSSAMLSDADRTKANALRACIGKFDSGYRSNLTELMTIVTGIDLKLLDYRVNDFVTILTKEGGHNYPVDSVVRLYSNGSDGRWVGLRKVTKDPGDNLVPSNFRRSTVDEVRACLVAANLGIKDLTTVLMSIDRRV